MKKLFLFSLLFVLPAIVFSQTTTDYVAAMDRYAKYYNQWLPDSISGMLPEFFSDKQKTIRVAGIENFKKQYGEIISSKYVTLETDPDRIAPFKVAYAAQEFILGITFDKDNNARIVPFEDHSSYIDSLLKKEINPATMNNNMVYNKRYRAAKKTATTIMITGFAGMGTGTILFVAGAASLFVGGGNSQAPPNQPNPNNNLSASLFIAGAVVFVTGSAMAIGGSIARHQKQRWALIAPANNEIGIAYNF